MFETVFQPKKITYLRLFPCFFNIYDNTLSLSVYFLKKGGKVEYLVKWRGYDDPDKDENTLEPYENLDLLFFVIYFFLKKNLGGQGGSNVNGGLDNKGLICIV